VHTRPQHLLAVKLSELCLGGIDCLEPLKLSFQVICLRCHQSATVHLATTATSSSSRAPVLAASATCSKCAQQLELEATPHLVHEHSNVVAHVTPKGCIPSDLLPCCFGAQCGGCGGAIALRNVQVCVTWLRLWCHTLCHTK
jgi:hypothetical protein